MNEFFFSGRPYNFKDKCFIYPPKLNEILDTPHFKEYETFFTVQQEDIDNLFTDNGEKETDYSKVLKPLEYLLYLAYSDEATFYSLKEAFTFFIKENVLFDFTSFEVIIGIDEDAELESDEEKQEYLNSLPRINIDDFEDFQNLIREAIGQKKIKPFKYDLPARARKMIDKARYRDTIKSKKEKNGISLGVIMSSICLMDCGINPLNIGELTYAAIIELFTRYQEKTQYETDLSFMTIPFADTKSIKPKYWIRNLDES